MSKELEALEKIKTGEFIECDACDANWHEGCMCCRKELCDSEEIKTIEKSLKVLEILKDKCKFIFIKEEVTGKPTRYEIRIMPTNEMLPYFNCLAIFTKDQEEFDLLKEVLE